MTYLKHPVLFIFPQEKQDDELSAGSEGPSEENTKVNLSQRFSSELRLHSKTSHSPWDCVFQEKGGIFSGMFKKAPKPAEAAAPDEVTPVF